MATIDCVARTASAAISRKESTIAYRVNPCYPGLVYKGQGAGVIFSLALLRKDKNA